MPDVTQIMKLPRSSRRYSQHFSVPSSSSRGVFYVVSQVREGGAWECSCPAWTRHTPRSDCKHIGMVRRLLAGGRVTTQPAGVPLPASIASVFKRFGDLEVE